MYVQCMTLYRVFLRAAWEAYVAYTYAIEKIRNITWSKSQYIRTCSQILRMDVFGLSIPLSLASKGSSKPRGTASAGPARRG